jgi:hypothetical protein
MRVVIKIFILFIILSLFNSVYSTPKPVMNIWQDPAYKVCDLIKQAAHLYEMNDIKKARTTALMSYFKGYDAEIEPAVRVTLGGPHVFAIERRFRDFSMLMTPNPDKNQIKKITKLASELCQLVYDDANALNAEHIQRQVFKVE